MEKSKDFMKSFDKESDAAYNESHTSTADGTNRRPTKPCMYYSNYEYCRFGNNCKFLHRRETTSKEFVSRQYTTSKVERNQNKKIPSVLAIKKKFPNERDQNLSNPPNTDNYKKSCRYYKAGNCDKGDECLFSHSFNKNTSMVASLQAMPNTTKNISQTSAKKMSVPVCQYFRRGFCNSGDRCKFYHPQTYPQNVKVGRLSTSDKNQISQCKEIDRKEVACLSGSGKDCVENEENSVINAGAQNNSCDTTSESIDKNDIEKLCKQADISLAHQDQSRLSFVDSMNSKRNEEIISDQKKFSEPKCTDDLPQNNDVPVNNVNMFDAAKVLKNIRIPLSANKMFSLSSTETEISQLR